MSDWKRTPTDLLQRVPIDVQSRAAEFAEGSVGVLQNRNGGGTGIRTQERVSPLTVFKTAAFDRSAIPPLEEAVDRAKSPLCSAA